MPRVALVTAGPALAVLLAAAALTAALGSCGGAGEPDEPPLEAGTTLTVYLSAPRKGDSARVADAVAEGARLALRDARGMAGSHEVRLVGLNSSGREPGPATGPGWEPGTVARNAQRAAANPRAVAYIGELDLGGSAVSVPITNDAGLLQVSPGDGLTSLTRRLPGAGGTGPERYYPDEDRSFLRLVPSDFLHASTLVGWAGDLGARRLAILHDGEVFGRELATEVALVTECQGLPEPEAQQIGIDPAAYPGLAEELAEKRIDTVLLAGGGGDLAPALAAALREELPRVLVFGAGGLANAPPSRAGGPDALLSPKADAIRVTRAALPEHLYPRAGRDVLRRLSSAGSFVPTDALYGYEAMAIVLNAIEEEGVVRDRAAVRDRALAPRVRRSIIGRYRVEPTGDVSTYRFGAYRRELGGLDFRGARLPTYRLAPPSPKLAEPASACGGLLRTGRENR